MYFPPSDSSIEDVFHFSKYENHFGLGLYLFSQLVRAIWWVAGEIKIKANSVQLNWAWAELDNKRYFSFSVWVRCTHFLWFSDKMVLHFETPSIALDYILQFNYKLYICLKQGSIG